MESSYRSEVRPRFEFSSAVDRVATAARYELRQESFNVEAIEADQAPSRSDLVDWVQPGTAGKDPDAAEQILFILVEEVIGSVDGRPQRSVPINTCPFRAGQDPKPVT